jgi:hypothetical protein
MCFYRAVTLQRLHTLVLIKVLYMKTKMNNFKSVVLKNGHELELQ